jgi:hypothetical protein
LIVVLLVGITAATLLAGMAAAASPTAAQGTPTPVAAPKPVGDLLSGRVVDAQGPVANAVVRLQNTKHESTTDQVGAFKLDLGRKLDSKQVITVTAWTPGFYTGWITTTAATKPVTIQMKAHYTTDNPDYDWFESEGAKGSAACALCHTQNPEWEKDLHSQSAVNPRFLTMYSGENVEGEKGAATRFGSDGKALPPEPGSPYHGPGFKLDYPNRDGNCAACHTPLASKNPNNSNCGWSGCHTTVTAQNAPQVPDGVSPMHLTGDAAEGITCEFCHKIGDVTLDPKTGLPPLDMPGILSYRLYRPHEGQELFFGPFDDIHDPDTYLPLQEESAFCAPCHIGVFGGVVGSGTVKDGVLIYNSYGEWLESPYSDPETGQTCQDCHMPVSEMTHFVFPEKGGLDRSGRIHTHTMPGAADEEFLRNAVTMTTTASLKGGQVLVDVQITNDKTGHHVPTDIPLRHLILVVTAAGPDGKPLPRAAGPVLPEWTGDYAGRPGKAYAKLLRDEWTGEVPTAAYWRPVTIVEDSRLAAFATDASRYTFKAPEAGAATVEARLLFRRAFQKLAEEKGWDDPDIVMEEARLTVK